MYTQVFMYKNCLEDYITLHLTSSFLENCLFLKTMYISQNLAHVRTLFLFFVYKLSLIVLFSPLFPIVKSALWALQGMTTQKMASQDPKQTANQHQRHERSMYVYIYEHMYTCIHNYNRLKESHNNGQFYSLSHKEKKKCYINMWKYIWTIF